MTWKVWLLALLWGLACIYVGWMTGAPKRAGIEMALIPVLVLITLVALGAAIRYYYGK